MPRAVLFVGPENVRLVRASRRAHALGARMHPYRVIHIAPDSAPAAALVGDERISCAAWRRG